VRYFLTAEDGNRYGPADEDVLKTWASQGRLTPHTVLEPEASGPTIMASDMPGLQFPPATQPYAPIQTRAPYGQQPYGQSPGYGQNQPFYTRPPSLAGFGSWEIPTAWGLGALGVLGIFCGMGSCFAALGIIVSVIGLVQGRRTFGPLILCIALLILEYFVFRSMGGLGSSIEG